MLDQNNFHIGIEQALLSVILKDLNDMTNVTTTSSTAPTNKNGNKGSSIGFA